MAATTTDIEAYFDVVELVQTQASATATYADAVHSDAYTSSEENAIAYSKTTAASGSTVRQTKSYVWKAGLNGLLDHNDLGTGEGVRITYGGVTKDFIKGTSPAITTVDDLVTAINADTTFGNGVAITAGKDGHAQSYNRLSYTDKDGGGETLGTGGTILVSLGTVTKVATTAGVISTVTDLAQLIAATLTGTVVDGVQYEAMANDDENAGDIVLTRVVTNTGSSDKGVNTSDFPDIAIITSNETFTTVDFSANGSTTNSTGVNSDFFIGFTQTNVNGLRVTVKNNSTSVALTVVVTSTLSTANTISALLSTTAAGAPIALVSGTNMPGNAAYASDFADISDETPAATTSKNRISWLG
jgi:hypothetical protein